MGMVNEVSDRQERPGYVRFERIAIEDKAASLAAGHYVARDVDYALITPPYSKDIFKQKVTSWLEDLETQVRNQRINPEWVRTYREAYRAWQNGQEIPLHGTPIRGWGVISPAQQETLIRMNVMTVEDLALINDEGIKRIGMGAIDLKNKAKAWLSQLQDKGPLTQEIAAVKAENDIKTAQITTLSRQVEELTAMMRNLQAGQQSPDPTLHEVVSINDVFAEPTREELVAAYADKFGKPPHHLMKTENIAKALE